MTGFDWLSIIAIIACLLLSFFFAGSETALMAFSRARMLRLEKKGNRSAGIVNRLLEQRERLIGALLLGNNAVNIAASLALSGARVGLLDGDIYGPTTPIMLGLETPPKSVGNRMIPQEAGGMKFISMGLLVKSDQPLIWRGPMAHKALQQCLFDVDWGELDYLIVDLPPGTGDVHLTLAQAVPLVPTMWQVTFNGPTERPQEFE